MAGPGLALKKRLLALLVIFTIVVGALLIQVALIQFVHGEEYQKLAYTQQTNSSNITPIRGTIYDRNGKELAISAQAGTISAFPNNIDADDADKIADGLAPMLGMEKETIYKLVTKKTNSVVLKRKIDRETEEKVRKWIKDEKFAAMIKIEEDAKRYYPDANLASHIVGFTGVDNQGLQGIEKIMDKYLKGVPGRILSEVDSTGRAIPDSTEMRIDAQDGLNVVLTIDETIQYLATKTLEKAIEDYKVKRGGIVIVMDPRNGDILAMVSKPDYDLNNPYAFPAAVEGLDPENWVGNSNEGVATLQKSVWRNKALLDTYEPGSTFKSFTTAAGIEEGVVKPDTITSDLPIKVAGWPNPIYCWRRGREHGTETFREGVLNSCNPVFVKVAQSLGIERFYNYVRAFGFYDKTGIILDEGKSIFQAKPKEIDMAVASFGQRFTITPIQLITGYTAIVNGGKLMKPRLVKELTDQEGNVVKKFEPEAIRTVISKQTSDTVRGILEDVVGDPMGTGNNAYVRGYRIGGKTGTSQTTEKGVYTASFSGFAPADNPVVCVLVALFDPQGESHMGGAIAAPTAGKIIEDVLNYLQVERRYTEDDLKTMAKEVMVPEVRNMTVEEAAKELKKQGLAYKLEGNGNNNSKVVEQMPKPDANVPQNSVVLLYTYKPEKQPTVKMPDLLNKNLSEATEAMKNAGLNIRISGLGVVVKQGYAPGTAVPKGEVVEVEFKHLDNIE